MFSFVFRLCCYTAFSGLIFVSCTKKEEKVPTPLTTTVPNGALVNPTNGVPAAGLTPSSTVAPNSASVPGSTTGGSASEAAQLNAPTTTISAAGASSTQPGGSKDMKGKATTTTLPQVQVTDVKPGNGAEARPGKLLRLHYTGTLTDGKKFDSSRDSDRPFEFTLGAGQVIKGWDQGLIGMKVNGIRKLSIPPELAYGNQALPGIPSNSTLVFEVELLSVK